MEAAIALIQREHDALGRVLRGLDEITHDIALQRNAPDFDLLAAMLYYIDQFPERFHHPREEETLFARIRNRTTGADQLLNTLQNEHQHGARLTADLALKLMRLQGGGQVELQSFSKAVADYLRFYWAHMQVEEDDLLPIAERVLSPADWAAIEVAFATNDDPIFGRSQDPRYSRVYSRIVNLAPRKVRMTLRSP